jgi:hypothetical protein
MANQEVKTKEVNPSDVIDNLVETLDRLAEKYGFTDEENALLRECIFGIENVRNAEEPLYDAGAEEMVVEAEPEYDEDEEDGEED